MQKYLEILDQLVENLKGQRDVEGILLFGSVAEGKVTQRSDIDTMVMVQNERPYYRDCKFIKGIWAEQYFKTYERLKSTIERKELVHVYMFKDGRILYDLKGRMSELKQIATKVVEEYKPTEEELRKKRLEIQLFIDDLLDMYETGKSDSVIFYMHNQYIIFDAFFMINDCFPPKFKDIFSRFKELIDKPENFNQLMEDIFFAYELEKRIKSFLELAEWTLQKLGGRFTEIKE